MTCFININLLTKFGFKIPSRVANVDSTILEPVNTWNNQGKYYQTQDELIKLFQNNYQQYQMKGMTDYSQYGPTI